MASKLPRRGEERPTNLTTLLREAYVSLNGLAVARLAECGHEAVRPAHGAVFQYLDNTGTTVTVLAERAQMTKQAMAELVAQLETHGYVIRVSDPNDQRAKLVLPTARGQELFTVVQKLAPKMEQRIRSMVGKKRARELCTDLKKLRRLESL
jgi:DNA-binding MarR family transcriptional regulator